MEFDSEVESDGDSKLFQSIDRQRRQPALHVLDGTKGASSTVSKPFSAETDLLAALTDAVEEFLARSHLREDSSTPFRLLQGGSTLREENLRYERENPLTMQVDELRFRTRLRRALEEWEARTSRARIVEMLGRDPKTVFTNWVDADKTRDVPFQAVAVIAHQTRHSLGWFIDEPAADRLDRIERKLDDLASGTVASDRALGEHLERLGVALERLGRQRAHRARSSGE